MSQLVLQYEDMYRLTHAHRRKGLLGAVLSVLDGARYDEDYDMIAMFFFSLQSKEDHDQGKSLGSDECFWTEVLLSRQLAETDGWKKLGKKAKLKVMFHHAVESLKEARRKLRQVTLHWTPGSGMEKGPAVDPSEIDFPGMEPIIVDFEPSDDLRFLARTGAGL